MRPGTGVDEGEKPLNSCFLLYCDKRKAGSRARRPSRIGRFPSFVRPKQNRVCEGVEERVGSKFPAFPSPRGRTTLCRPVLGDVGVHVQNSGTCGRKHGLSPTLAKRHPLPKSGPRSPSPWSWYPTQRGRSPMIPVPGSHLGQDPRHRSIRRHWGLPYLFSRPTILGPLPYPVPLVQPGLSCLHEVPVPRPHFGPPRHLDTSETL